MKLLAEMLDVLSDLVTIIEATYMLGAVLMLGLILLAIMFFSSFWRRKNG